MKIKNTFALLAAAAVSMTVASTAKADLNGTTIDLSVTHDGMFGPLCAINNESYTYGSPAMFTPIDWTPLVVTSPDFSVAGFDNTVTLDFTLFQYNPVFAFAPATGTAKLLNLADPADLSSVQVLTNGIGGLTNITVDPATDLGTGFKISWATASVLGTNPANPNVIIAWNSTVPAPGALALLGCAGLVAGRRRRN